MVKRFIEDYCLDVRLGLLFRRTPRQIPDLSTKQTARPIFRTLCTCMFLVFFFFPSETFSPLRGSLGSTRSSGTLYNEGSSSISDSSKTWSENANSFFLEIQSLFHNLSASPCAFTVSFYIWKPCWEEG